MIPEVYKGIYNHIYEQPVGRMNGHHDTIDPYFRQEIPVEWQPQGEGLFTREEDSFQNIYEAIQSNGFVFVPREAYQLIQQCEDVEFNPAIINRIPFGYIALTERKRAHHKLDPIPHVTAQVVMQDNSGNVIFLEKKPRGERPAHLTLAAGHVEPGPFSQQALREIVEELPASEGKITLHKGGFIVLRETVDLEGQINRECQHIILATVNITHQEAIASLKDNEEMAGVVFIPREEVDNVMQSGMNGLPFMLHGEAYRNAVNWLLQ